MFLNELEEILELLGADQLSQVSTMLFTNLARCLDSDHFQVVERALFLWNNEVRCLSFTSDHICYLVFSLIPFPSSALGQLWMSIAVECANGPSHHLWTALQELVWALECNSVSRYRIVLVSQYVNECELTLLGCSSGNASTVLGFYRGM